MSCSGGMPAEVFFSFCSPHWQRASRRPRRRRSRYPPKCGFHPVQHVAADPTCFTVTPAGIVEIDRLRSGDIRSALCAATAMATCLPDERLAM
jgi:hypothetical protein